MVGPNIFVVDHKERYDLAFISLTPAASVYLAGNYEFFRLVPMTREEVTTEIVAAAYRQADDEKRAAQEKLDQVLVDLQVPELP